MGDPHMAIGEADVQRIGEYVKPWIRGVIAEMMPPRAQPFDRELLERMVRVEEELKSQRELMDERFVSMDRRFEEARDRDRRSDWFMAVGFTIVTVAVTLVGVLL